MPISRNLAAFGALLLASMSSAQNVPPENTVPAAPAATVSARPAAVAERPNDATGDASPVSQVPPPPSGPIIPLHEDKRAYGVLPNYRTAEADAPFSSITSHQKFMIGVKDSFDGVAYPLAAFFSGISQLSDQNPSFGQGLAGYSRRYGTAFADQVIGNMLTESMLPIALREDPRFFRKGSGRFWARVAYSASRVLVCKTNSGRGTFNFSEVMGNGLSASVANLYYPDNRGLSPTLNRMVTQIGTDSFSNVLKEFWPDVKRYYQRKHREKQERQQKNLVIAAE